MTKEIKWSDIAAIGTIEQWLSKELRRLGLSDDTDPSKLAKKQLKLYKEKRDEERRVRKELQQKAWRAYQKAHIVHLGQTIFYVDQADIDIFDIADLENRRESNEIPSLNDLNDLAKALNLSISEIRWLCYHRDVDNNSHYHYWNVPKRDGGSRLISAPKPKLKQAQTWISRNIVEQLPIHGAAHGFVAGRSTVSNAACHAGAEIVIKLDLENFFPTIHWRRVKGLFRKAGYIEQVATLLALLCSEAPREEMNIKGQRYFVALGERALPQGAPSSPALTNHLCFRLDCRLSGLATKMGCQYSRYADDLTFSSKDSDLAIGQLIGAVKMIVGKEGFIVHNKKTRILRSGRRQKITGLVVNEAPGKPPARVPRYFVRTLRAALHNREQGRPGKGESLVQLKGWIAYIHMTDPDRAKPFYARLKRLEESNKGDNA